MDTRPQVFFEDVQPGDESPPTEFGPFTVVDAVRWAGLQENWQHLHFDRDHVRHHSGLRTFIASGAYRQALLVRTLTDWVGLRGRLRKLNIRHTYSTFEGDRMCFVVRVVEKSLAAADPWIKCEVQGNNQDGRQILCGHCTLLFPSREAP